MQVKHNTNSFFWRIISVVIDVVILFIISISVWIVAENASGYLFPRIGFMSEYSIIHTFKWVEMFFVLLALLYYIIAAFNKWDTIGKIVYENWRRIILSFSATIVDFTCVLIFTLLLDQLLQKNFYIETFNILFVVLFCYALVSGVITKGKTIGKYFFGINLQIGNNRTKSLKYEMCKFGILIAIPYLSLLILGIVDSYAIFLNIVLFAQLVVLFSFICCKRTLWAKFADVPKTIKQISTLKLFVCFFAIIVFFAGSFTLLQYNNNRQQSPDHTILFGFNLPVKFPEYPNTSKVQPYSEFMKTQTLSPKEYILSLFERYDIVILEEAFHGESTQWEMISDIVADSVFIKQIGNIFTEYGSAMHQNRIDTFLHTVFPNETELEKATAMLMNYMTVSFYYFTKNLNLLNTTLPDSLKIREHYCDNTDWDYFSTIPISISAYNYNRDSLMAQVVIDWYKHQTAEGKRHKCLVVTNTRHAFGYPGGVEKIKNGSFYLGITQGNQGQYIFEAYPDKTANVTRNSPKWSRTFFMPFSRPIHHGIWDKAFEINRKRPVGFDLKDTPFGEDSFNSHMTLRGINSKLKYSDIYTGVVFDRPYTEFEQINHHYYPYKQFAIEEEAKRKGMTYMYNTQSSMENHSDNESEEKHDDEINTWNLHDLFNFGGVYFVLFFIMGLSILFSFIYLLKRVICHSKEYS